RDNLQFDTSIIPLPRRPMGFAVADLNRDGRQDIFVAMDACRDTTRTCVADTRGLMVLTGDSFADQRGFATPTPAHFLRRGAVEAVAVADVDRDGIPDCITIESAPPRLCVFRGNSAGSLESAASALSLPSGTGPTALALADEDRDGRVDAVIAGTANSTI